MKETRELNHGHTQTGFANARLDSEWRKRKRGAYVLVCGLLQRFERVGVEEEGLQPHECDTIVVHPEPFYTVDMSSDLKAKTVYHGCFEGARAIFKKMHMSTDLKAVLALGESFTRNRFDHHAARPLRSGLYLMAA